MRRLTKLVLISALVFSTFNPTAAPAASEQVVSLNNDGVNALKANNYVLATQKFLACLKLDPTYKLAKENMANCYNNWGISLNNNPSQAIEKFHKSLFYGRDNLTASQNLEEIIKKLGKDPHSFDDRVSLGKQARLAGDFEGGIVEFAEALKIKDSPALRVELAVAYYACERVDDAIAQYEIASQSQDLDHDTMREIYRSLGQAYQAKEDYLHSCEAYNKAIKLNLPHLKREWPPKALYIDPPVHPFDNEQEKNFSQQSFMIQEAFRQAQVFDIAESLFRIGSAYQDKGDYKAAIGFYLQALKKQSD